MIAVDSVIIFLTTYLLATVEQCPWDFTILQKLLISIVAVVIYLFLSQVKVLGGVLMMAISAFVTWFIFLAAPVMKWVNGNKIAYWCAAVGLFLFLCLLHGYHIKESFSDVIFKIKMKRLEKKRKNAKQQSNSSTSGRGYYEERLDLMAGPGSLKMLLDKEIRHKCIVAEGCQYYLETICRAYDIYGKISWISLMVREADQTLAYSKDMDISDYRTDEDFRKAFDEVLEYIKDVYGFVKCYKLDYGYSEVNPYVLKFVNIQVRAAHSSSYSYAGQGQQEAPRKSDDASKTINFFAGCKSEEEIKKRLRTLTKTFHPDNSEGDEKTYKQILAEYEKVKGDFSNEA